MNSPLERPAATRVMLVEDDAGDAQLIQDALAGSVGHAYQVIRVADLAAALAHLAAQATDVILLDLSLPDAQGIEAFDQILAAAPRALILVLSGASDEELAQQAMQRGAHDFFAKGHIDAYWLPHALRYVLERKRSQDALRDSEARFRAMSDASPLGIFVSDAAGDCVYTNAAYHQISGLDFAQALGTSWSMAVHPDDRQRIVVAWRAAVASDEPFQAEVRFLRRDGSTVWTRLNAAPMLDGLPGRGRVQIVEDISQRKADDAVLQRAQEELFAEQERAQVTLNSIGDAVLSTDAAGNVTYLNQVAETMTGWSTESALGQPLTEVFRIIDGASREPVSNPGEQAIAENRIVGLAADSILIRRDGTESAIEDSSAPIHDRNGQVTGAVIVFHDVSESRAMAQKMSHLAQHDFLTGLPNRVLLTERFERAIGQARRHHKQVAMLFLDLDYFKNINDSLGHVIGDQLLQSVAARLVACVRSTDTVCRQGGDEFVILLAEIEHHHDASQVADKLLASLIQPHLIEGNELHVTLSIGISIFPDDGDGAETLMQNADTAMYYAKASGRNNYQFFKGEMNIRAVQRLFVENNLRRALKQEEFELHYQPMVAIANGRISRVEALLRWRDPHLGMVYPGQFVPIAEECGLIVPIGRWVLREACRQLVAWIDAGLPALPVSVNISAVEFRHRNFVDGVAGILEETGLPPALLELELTESILMHEVEASARVLEKLKAMGVQLAIDDFGTGYSSLSYLNRFPIDTLKIDQSFVRDMATNRDDAAIVGAVIDMGRNLRQRVVAEGVETREQLALLCRQECEEGQGFLFSYPLPPAEFALLLAARKDIPACCN
ncbi:MAG: diguanylate cyclase [Betaproteobacteria bacterium HGW-Betaproteobacteria-12]|nr:MAG: diguanylate cyclase [Betaproteobacteria bacterium HGW-Betaproteobacteria-12]